ncbi:MAG: hypothetical protein OEO83_14550, partial [Alphaproteobacteria bacterium]|nr:hypothetical protein [Alphaproteobacteria bacterium]
MGLNMEPSEHRLDQPGGKPRQRHRARWVTSVCVGIAIIVAAGFYWRLPLAGAVLRVALDRAGIDDATLTVSALSTSRIRLTDVRLGSGLAIGSVEAAFNLSRLPENPVTRLAFDGVRSDLAETDRTLREMFGNRRDGETPATIRTLLDRMAGLPAIAVTDLSLHYAPAGAVLAITGSAEAGRDTGGIYAVKFAMRLSGELKGEARAVEVDGAARIAKDATTLEVRAKTSDGAVGGILTGRADLSSDHAAVSGGVRLELRDLGRLALITPVMEGAGGRVVGTARINTPVAIGLDTPVDLSGVAAALQRSSPGAFKLEAAIEDGSHVTGLRGINGTISALVGSVPDASDELRVDGMLSLQARRLMAG